MNPSQLTDAVIAPMISDGTVIRKHTWLSGRDGSRATLLVLHMGLPRSISALNTVTSAKQGLGLTLSLNRFPHRTAGLYCLAGQD